MSARRVWGVGVAAAVLLSAGAVVSPATSAQPVRRIAPLTDAPPFAVRTQDSARSLMPQSNRADLLRLVAPDAHPATAMDALRADLAHRMGLRLPDMHPSTSLRSASGAEASVQISFTGTSPAGDLNGNGTDDVLVFNVGETVDTAALEGGTGAVLWQRSREPVDDMMAMPLADVSGDGANDLFSVTLEMLGGAEWGEPCSDVLIPVAQCEHGVRQSFRWTYGVVSGRDGVTLWQQSVDGASTYREWRTQSGDPLDSRTEEGQEYEETNEWLFLDAAGDHDGDGHRDVVLNQLGRRRTTTSTDRTRYAVLNEQQNAVRERFTTEGAVLSGETGAVILSKRAVDAPDAALLLVAPQLVGDGTPDLLWDTIEGGQSTSTCEGLRTPVSHHTLDCEYEHAEMVSARVAALDGRTLEQAWVHSVEVPAWAFIWSYVLPDLTGDGVAEVAVVFWDAGTTTRYVSGATGEVLWRGAGIPQLAGEDLTGTGRPDVVTVSVRGSTEWDDPVVLTLERRVGATGALFDSEELTLDTSVEDVTMDWITVKEVHAGGTSSTDLLVSFVQLRFIGGAPSAATQEVAAEGRGGVLSDVVHEDQYRWTWDIGDVDGDGRTDLHVQMLRVVRDEDDWNWSSSESVSPIGGADFWLVPEGAWLMAGGNHDGVAGDELVLVSWTQSDDGMSRAEISSVAGTTGERRWTYSDE